MAGLKCLARKCVDVSGFFFFSAYKAQILPQTSASSPLLQMGAQGFNMKMGSKTDIQGKALSLFLLFFPHLLPTPFPAGAKAGVGLLCAISVGYVFHSSHTFCTPLG